MIVAGGGDDSVEAGGGRDRAGAAADVDRIFASGGSDSYDVFDGDPDDVIDCSSPCTGSADAGDDVGGLAATSITGN